jgi:hypothetical protein
MTRLMSQLGAVACLFGIAAAAVAGQSAGDEPDKLVRQGDGFRSHGRLNEALWAYRQAARSGNVKGALAAGDMLFSQGKEGSCKEQMLKLSEGFGYLFFAATNRNPQACARLADALQNGTGIPTNLACAYAWMEVAAQSNPSFRTNLDLMVVQLEPSAILKAQKLAREYISGHWPERVARPIDQGDPRFQIQGMSVSGQKSVIVLNGDSLTVGDSINVVPLNTPKSDAGGKLMVSCLEIGRDFALMAVAGEPNLKMLTIDPR